MDRLDIRVGQHAVKEQMRKGDTSKCDLQVGHMGKVGLGRLPRAMDLGEDDLVLRSMLSAPGGDMAL